MPIHYPDILSERSERRQFSYSEKDVLLYALAIGMGDEEGERALSFLYERDLRVVPSAATVLGGSIMPVMHQQSGLRASSLNFPLVVHGEQKVELHRVLAPADTLFTETRTVGVSDKGADKGALVITETRWTTRDDAPVATLTNSIFARGDGGFGGPSGGAPEPHSSPARSPDARAVIGTRLDQALLYRLNGDWNPLHVDPSAAVRAGYPRPILHGLCTYGIACRAVLGVFANFDVSRIRTHAARFAAPAYPGEQLLIDLWRDDDVVSFEVTAIDRGVKVIRNGRTELHPDTSEK